MKAVILLSFDYPPKRGGISTYTFELAEALKRSGRPVHLLVPGHVYLPSSALLSLPFFLFHLWRAAKKNPDATILCTNWLPGGLAAAISGKPYHLTAHGSEIFPDQGWRFAKNWLRAFTLKRAKAVFAVSSFTAEKVRAVQPRANVAVIPNGVNTSVYSAGNITPPSPFKVITVCRLEKHKGVDTALRALAPLLKNGKVDRYMIVGKGREESRLRALAIELGVAGLVEFRGNVPDHELPRLYREASLHLLLSREEASQVEGFGLVFLEAAASGITSVGTVSGGIPDAVLDGKTGILVPADDEAAARAAIERLAADSELRGALAARASQRAHQELSWTAVAEMIGHALEKKKICCFCVATHLGGAERSLLEYLRYARKQSALEIELLFPMDGGAFFERAESLGIKCRVVTMPPALLRASRHGGRHLLALPGAFVYLARLVAFLRRERYDLIYTTGIKSHIFGAMAGKLSHTKVAWHLRDHLAGQTRRTLRLLKALPNLRVAANSVATAASLGARVEPEVIYNGINPEDFPFGRSDHLHRRLGLGSSTRIVGIVGVLARWKGQAEFLRMASNLINRGLDLHFVVIGDQIYDTAGDTGYIPELHQLALDLGISRHISFLGYQTDPSACIRSMDVLVHASLKPEPFGRVIIEAMACGTPVAASAAGGPLEIMEDGVDGVFHPPGDIDAMAANVEKLLDSSVAEKIRAHAFQKFREKFTHERYSETLHRFVISAAENRLNS